MAIITVALCELQPMQLELSRSGVEGLVDAYRRHDSVPDIKVAEFQGRYAIANGHNRAYALYMLEREATTAELLPIIPIHVEQCARLLEQKGISHIGDLEEKAIWTD
ncbi:hypothetical protein HYU15_02215 [Candidatus Woesearchaeota archaeon]|nr:hypothetical protein [Candidatus Woesearchaeota archaeon]